MAKRKSKKKAKSTLAKSLISLILVLILAIAGYAYQDELPFELPFDLSAIFGSETTLPTGSGTVGGPLSDIPSIADPEYLTVHYIDVGQSDSILITCGGEYLLIDAGETDSKNTVIHYLNDLGIEELDLVIATHATPVRSVCTAAMGQDFSGMSKIGWTANASISVFEYENGRFTAVYTSRTDHLGDLSTFLPSNV